MIRFLTFLMVVKFWLLIPVNLKMISIPFFNNAAANNSAAQATATRFSSHKMMPNSMNRAELVEALEKMGEQPPPKWSKMELRHRLMELYEENGISYGTKQKTELRQGVILLNQVSRKKLELQKWCRDQLQIPVTGQETISQLQRLAMIKLYQTTQPDGSDPVGFGKASSLTYSEILSDVQYCQWVMITAQEGQCSPQLSRLARWIEMQKHEPNNTNNEVTMKKGYTEPQPKIMPKAKAVKSSASQASASSNATMEALASIMETMKELKEEVNELKSERPRKKEKDSDGSFVRVDKSQT